MSLTINRRSTNQINLMELIHLAFLPQIDIYGQAVLKRTEAIQLYQKDLLETDDYLNIFFPLSGELEGHILCQIRMDTHSKNTNQIQSLFIESMNILLGHLCTALDEQAEIMCLIQSPKVLSNKELNDMDRFDFKLKTKYKLITLQNEISCNIFINANRKLIKEV